MLNATHKKCNQKNYNLPFFQFRLEHILSYVYKYIRRRRIEQSKSTKLKWCALAFKSKFTEMDLCHFIHLMRNSNIYMCWLEYLYRTSDTLLYSIITITLRSGQWSDAWYSRGWVCAAARRREDSRRLFIIRFMFL